MMLEDVPRPVALAALEHYSRAAASGHISRLVVQIRVLHRFRGKWIQTHVACLFDAEDGPCGNPIPVVFMRNRVRAREDMMVNEIVTSGPPEPVPHRGGDTDSAAMYNPPHA